MEYSYIQYSRNIILGIFPGISQGTFSEYFGNISWECSTNIPRTYICLVGKISAAGHFISEWYPNDILGFIEIVTNDGLK